MSESIELYDNDKVWARFYRDGKNLGDIASEFGCSIYALSPWLVAPIADAAFEAANNKSSALAAKDAEIEAAHAENNRLRGLIEEAIICLDGEPEYHDQGMGCGLEDRGITDRYEAMSHGWDQAMERVYGENIAWAKDALSSALKGGAQ